MSSKSDEGSDCPSECHHAVCAWCRTTFATVLELIEHAEVGHTSPLLHAA